MCLQLVRFLRFGRADEKELKYSLTGAPRPRTGGPAPQLGAFRIPFPMGISSRDSRVGVKKKRPLSRSVLVLFPPLGARGRPRSPAALGQVDVKKLGENAPPAGAAARSL